MSSLGPDGGTDVPMMRWLSISLVAAVLASCAASSELAGDAGPDAAAAVPWPSCIPTVDEPSNALDFECDLGLPGTREEAGVFVCVCEPKCPACPSPPYPWLRVRCGEDLGCEIECGPDEDCGPGWICQLNNRCREIVE